MHDVSLTANSQAARHNVAGANAASQTLRRKTREFVSAWRELTAREWNAEGASALHEELEQLAAAADDEGAREIADPALELTVYLCSFVDEGVQPDLAQRRALQVLIDTLAAACGMMPTRQVTQKTPGIPDHKHWQVLYLRQNADDLPGLSAQLGQRGFIVRLCKDVKQLLLTLDNTSPDVLVIDETFASELNGLVEAVERKRPPHKDPPLCVLLARETDGVRASFAQRAGAHAVITERDPIALVTRVDELLAQRHGLGYRILIVEDDRGQAKFCESILRHRDMVTSICETAERVPSAIAEFRPDLVLLDLYLPDSNGIEVAQRIREQPGTALLPVVFLSGEHDLDLRFDAISSGADDFITKPVKPRHLITAVESRVRRVRQLSQSPRSEGRGERRGTLSGRDVFAREVLRIARDEQDRCPTLALVAVDDPEQAMRNAGFVAAGALAQQIAAALAAELKGVRLLCAYGDLKFLIARSPDSEAAARDEYQSLRNTLDSRQWGSAEVPLRMHFSMGCARLPAEIGGVEASIGRVQALCTQAQSAGGARCEFDLHAQGAEDDIDQPLRNLLRAPSLRGAAKFAFQPLLQLGGHLTGQYAVRLQVKSPLPGDQPLLSCSEYLELARKLNMHGQAERLYVRALLELARERSAGKQSLRLHLPVTAETALDPAFAPWLAAEIGAQGVSAGLLVLHLAGHELHRKLAHARLVLESLQRLGLRLGVDLRDEDDKIARELLQVESIHVVKFQASEDPACWTRYAPLISEARSLGKTVIAAELHGTEQLGALLRLGVHYVRVDVLAGWSPEWNFEFVAIV